MPVPQQVECLLAGMYDDNANPLSGGLVYSYEAGTSVPKALYSSASLGTTHPNPLTLNSMGRALAYGVGAYKLVIRDSDDRTIATYDNLRYGYSYETSYFGGTSTNVSNAYSITTQPLLFYLDVGARITFQANFTNTGAATLNPNGFGAKPIKNNGNNLSAGDLQANTYYDVQFDGTNYNLRGSSLTSITSIPAGVIAPYGGGSAPSGWLLCDGASYSTATYPSLYAIIGYAYGGSGGNFNVPDLRRRTPYGAGTGFARADSDGEATDSNRLLDHNHGAHSHNIPDHTHAYGSLYAAMWFTGYVDPFTYNLAVQRLSTPDYTTDSVGIVGSTNADPNTTRNLGVRVFGTSGNVNSGVFGVTDTTPATVKAPRLGVNYIIKQ